MNIKQIISHTGRPMVFRLKSDEDGGEEVFPILGWALTSDSEILPMILDVDALFVVDSEYLDLRLLSAVGIEPLT